MNKVKSSQKIGSTALLVLILLCLVAALSMGQAYAALPPTISLQFLTDLPASKSAAVGSDVNLSVQAQVLGTPGAILTYKWYKDGQPIGTDAAKFQLTNVQKENYGVYKVVVTSGATESITSTECTLSPAAASGGLTVVGYTVQNAAGGEIQRIGTGEKCQIIIKVHDSRFTSIPAGKDGKMVDIKITTTSTFATPSFGDISYTTPLINANGVLEYAIVFRDIMYLGGSNALSFDIAYTDYSVAMQNVSVGISECYNPADIVTTKPSIMVRNSSHGDMNINAGSPFSLSITSYNTSKAMGVTDVVTSISLPASITLAGGSNTVLTANVGPGGSFVNNFALQAQSATETGVANINITYTFYVQGTSEQISASQIVTVPIVQPDRFSFTSLDAQPEIYAGEESSITLNYVNKGKGILYNLSAEIAGNIATPGQNQYLGNLNSGTEGAADFVVKSDGVGTVSGVITITYEDVNGIEKKVTQDYSMNVLAAPTVDPMDPGMFPQEIPEEAAGMPWWVWLLIALAVAGTGTGIIVGVKKKKAKKRAQELADEDDENEDF